MNLSAQFKNYLSEARSGSARLISKITIKNYLSDVNHFIKWFEEEFKSAFSPDLVTAETIEYYKKVSSKSFSVSSIERHLSSLRKFFKFLKLEGYISYSPFSSEAGSRFAREQPDPYRLKDFKDYLYVYNASSLTIKNYIIDVKHFLQWAEQVTKVLDAWKVEDQNLFRKIDGALVEEYKNRLVQSRFSPRSVNRNLSSLRKYLSWAEGEGLIEARGGEVEGLPTARRFSFGFSKKRDLENRALAGGKQRQDPERTSVADRDSYSKFPPFRIIQKTIRVAEFLLDLILINPLASAISAIEYSIWKLRGKPVFKSLEIRSIRLIRNLPKAFYAPYAVSTEHFPIYKKLFHHIKHTRPKWYKLYHSYSFTHYLHLAILVILMSAIGFAFYDSFSQKPPLEGEVLGALPQSPPRLFSFQGRLTDASDNPITAATDLRFGIYDADIASGSALKWQEVNTVTPDADGVFSVLLGKKTSLSQSIFINHAGLWLGVTVGKTPELTPRQQIASVAFAQNSDLLQGLPPITQSGAGTTNVVLALNSSGNLSIGGTATPTFEATGGKFTLSGSVLSLTTLAGSNSNIELKPDGIGKIDLQEPLLNTSNNNNVTTARGAVEINDLFAILATSSGQSAFTINQNDVGPIISASSSGTAKFTLSNAGAGTFADDLAVNGGDITSTQTTFNLLNSTVTTLSIGGAATTINLGATTGTTTTANSLSILGNTTLGDTAADTITLTGALNSNFLPDANNTRNLGSSSLRFGTVFGVNGDFTNISGTVTGGSTSSNSWTINSDNATANAEIGSLAFETGTANFNAVMQWNALGDAGRISGYDNTNLFNFPVGIFSQVSGGNQSFTSGTLFKYGQPTAHAITQSGAFIGADYDFSTNITVPNSASGNQTGFKTTLKDGGASATAIGFQTAGTLDFGLDIGGTIGTADIRLSNAETISNLVDGTISLGGATTSTGLITASAGLTLAANQNLTLSSGTGVYSQTFTGTTTNPFAITASAVTTGNVVDLANASTAATSSDLIQGDHTATYTAATTVSGQLLDLSRALTINAAATTLTVSGAVAAISDNCTVTAGTCTSTADVLAITQSFASNSGAALNVTTAGTGLALRVNDDGTLTDSTPFVVDASGSVGIGTATPTAGDNLTVSGVSTIIRSVGSSSGNLFLQNTGTGAREWRIFTHATASPGTLAFQDNTAGQVRMLIDTSGNVGIGTTSPGQSGAPGTYNKILHVKDATSGNQVALNLEGTANGADILFSDSGAWKYLMGWNGADFRMKSTDIDGAGTDGTILTITLAGQLQTGITTPGTVIRMKNATYISGDAGGVAKRLIGTLATGQVGIDPDVQGVRVFGGIELMAAGSQAAPTGGNKGGGTINAAGDIYKNDSAYTNPDYAFEHYFKGKIIEFADREGASDYPGLRPLEEVENYAKANYQLPRVGTRRGIFERGDIVLEKIEELYLYLFEFNRRIAKLEEKSCVQSESSTDFGLVESVCSKSTIEKLADSGTYAVKNYLGEVATGGQILAEAVVGTIRAGYIEANEVISNSILVNRLEAKDEIISPLAQIDKLQTDIISPLTSDKIVIKLESKSGTVSSYSNSLSPTPTPKLEVQNASGSAVASIDDSGNASFSGTLNSFGLVTQNASVSGTLTTKNLIAENIESSLLTLKDQVSSLSGSLITNDQLPITDYADIASYSAQLAYVDTLQAQVGTFMQGLFAVGPSSLSDATIFGQLSIGGSLILVENSINVLGSDLQIQPLGQGGVSIAGGNVYIDTSGNLSVSGNATIKGTLFANFLSPVPGSELIEIKNASGSAVASINSKGEATFKKLNLSLIEPAFALSEIEAIATGSAGVATISAQQKQLTIRNELVTSKSLIYISPVGTPSAQIPFLLRQNPNESFTVGLQNESELPLLFNWLIIN